MKRTRLSQRRRIAPLPIEELIDHPGAEKLPSAGYGMLCRLTHWYWKTNCTGSLPESMTECRSIMRAHRATWASHGKEVMRIFTDIRPSLDHHYEILQGRRSILAAVRERAHAAVRAKNATKRLEKQQTQAFAKPAPQLRSDKREERVEARQADKAKGLFSD